MSLKVFCAHMHRQSDRSSIMPGLTCELILQAIELMQNSISAGWQEVLSPCTLGLAVSYREWGASLGHGTQKRRKGGQQIRRKELQNARNIHSKLIVLAAGVH